jgi:protoheme IX farnesyltransferase
MKGSMKDWVALSKARIQFVSTSAALVCLWIADGGDWQWVPALHLVIGLTLVSSAAAAINQVLEVNVDKRMPRTCDRPLPTGRIRMRDAHIFCVATTVIGTAWLAWFLNPLTAWLGVVMLVLYCFIYTPLKRVTPLNTLVGAVPGAMPLLVGYAAAGNGLNILAGTLFLILFLWQLPHFFAIAWLYREDYRAGGLVRRPGVDESGAAAARQSIHYALALVPVSMAPTVFGIAGRVYFYSAFTMSLAFLVAVLFFSLRRQRLHARLVFFISIIYLPLLFVLLVVDSRL